MSLMLELATGTVTTSDVAVITVPAGEVWEVKYITIQQPGSSTAKNLKIGRGTTATAANVKANRPSSLLTTAAYTEVIFLPLGLVAAQTLNMIVDAGTTELSFTVQGFKTKVS